MNPVAAWRRYWFRPSPVLDLAIARLVAVGFQTLNIAFLIRPMTKQFPNLVTLRGLYSPLALLRFVFRPVDPAWFPTLGFLHGLYWLTIAAGAMAFVGLATNAALIVFAAGSAVLQAYMYSFNEVHHGEAILAFTLVFLALSPCGRRLSLDSLIRRVRETIRARKFVPSHPLEETSDAAGWPIRGLLWLYALIYASAAYYKLRDAGLAWMNGYTLRYFLLQDGLRWHMKMGLALSRYQTLAVLMSAASLAFEASFFLVLIFPRLVLPYAIGGFLLHSGIHFTMKANFWEFILLYFAIVPWTSVLSSVRARWGGRLDAARMEMIYDGECFLCLRSMAVLDSLDWLGRLRFAAFQDAGVAERCAVLGITPADMRRELQLLLPDGTIRHGFFAFRRLAWSVPLLAPAAPLMYLPGAAIMGPRVYRFIAERRRRFETCENDACRL